MPMYKVVTEKKTQVEYLVSAPTHREAREAVMNEEPKDAVVVQSLDLGESVITVNEAS